MEVPTLSVSILCQEFKRVINKEGMCSVLVYGRKGIGKTTVAMLLSYEIYNNWDMVLNHLIFEPEEFSRLLEDYEDERVPCIIFDDAGTWLNKYRYRSHEIVAFCRLYDLMRSLVAVVIFTTPHPHNILRYIREDVDVFIKVREHEGTVRECDVYRRFYTHPIPRSGEIRKGTLVMDKMLIDLSDLPKRVYEKYLTKRRKAIRKALKDFLRFFGTKEYYTLKEASQILNYTYRNLLYLIEKGVLNVVEINGKRYIHRDELKRILDIKGRKGRVDWGDYGEV